MKDGRGGQTDKQPPPHLFLSNSPLLNGLPLKKQLKYFPPDIKMLLKFISLDLYIKYLYFAFLQANNGSTSDEELMAQYGNKENRKQRTHTVDLLCSFEWFCFVCFFTVVQLGFFFLTVALQQESSRFKSLPAALGMHGFLPQS